MIPIAGALLLSFVTSARAEIMVAESVEWLVEDSDLVVRATFVGREEIDAWPKGWSVSTWRVERTLFGDCGETVDALARDHVGEQNGECLLFLKRHEQTFEAPALKTAAEGTPWEIRTVLPIDGEVEAFRMDGKPLLDRNDLLSATVAACAHRREALFPPDRLQVEVAPGTDAYQRLYGGSGVYLVVPVDDRLARYVERWRRSEDPFQREIVEGLRDPIARWNRCLREASRDLARKLADAERTRADLLERLADTEARLAACRTLVRRSLDEYSEDDPRRALLALRLSRLSPGPEDRAAAVAAFGHDFDALAAAAKATLWPVVLEERRTRNEWKIDLCERIDGRVARNVLCLQADGDGKLEYLATVEARLYCFADPEGPHGWKAYYLNRERVVYDGLGKRPDKILIKPWKSRGAAYAVPADMSLDSLALSRENAFHWVQNAFGTPVWAARFILPEFADDFPPRSPIREGETDPQPR